MGREETFASGKKVRRGRGGHHMVQPTQHVDAEGGGGGVPNLTRVAPI